MLGRWQFFINIFLVDMKLHQAHMYVLKGDQHLALHLFNVVRRNSTLNIYIRCHLRVFITTESNSLCKLYKFMCLPLAHVQITREETGKAELLVVHKIDLQQVFTWFFLFPYFHFTTHTINPSHI